MRIVSGVWAGKELVSPGKRVRATSEAVRDRWMSYLEPHLEGARVLDLFAGSGALGLEALSRGAAHADFVEDAPVALHALKANVAARKLRAPKPGAPPTARMKAARVFKRDAIPFVNALEEGSYDLAFADPPYGSRKLDLVVQRWREVRFARLLAVEHEAAHPLPEGGKKLDFGEIVVTVFGLPRKRSGAPRRPRGAPRRREGKTPTADTGKHPSRRTRKPPQDRG
ncbi:MAG: hypothetical protein AMXMBFR53_30740 [Gemmatimonadota bacterium]